MKFDS